MKMIKKWSCFVIAVSFLACVCIHLQSEKVFADTYQDPETGIEYTYEEHEEGMIDILQITVPDNDAAGKVSIPNIIQGKEVSGFFLGSDSNVTEIQYTQDYFDSRCRYEINGCETLQKIAVRSYGNIRIENCMNLENIRLGSDEFVLTTISIDFDTCPSIRELILYTRDVNYENLDLSRMSSLKNVQLYGFSIGKLNLSGLKGLEQFVSQTDAFGYYYSSIREIDFSGCNQLLSIRTNGICLDKVNLDGCKALQSLSIGVGFHDTVYETYNYLSELKLDSCTDLRYLDCSSNRIRVLDLSRCKQLETLDCGGNCLDSLNLKNNKKLQTLDCYYNNLQEIKLPANIKLKGKCFHNFLRKKPSLQMIKYMSKKRVLPQDKIAKTSIGRISEQKYSGGKNKINVLLDSRGHVTRYQVQVKKKGASKWTTYTFSPTHRKTIKNLKSGKKYLVRARVQLKVEKKWFKGSWSPTWIVAVK